MDDVRRARNREVKKFHSDRFLNDPERLETSKKIMQIYNAAYDRLKAHYRGQSS
jgi:curved DNA-binding protein CbpA